MFKETLGQRTTVYLFDPPRWCRQSTNSQNCRHRAAGGAKRKDPRTLGYKKVLAKASSENKAKKGDNRRKGEPGNADRKIMISGDLKWVANHSRPPDRSKNSAKKNRNAESQPAICPNYRSIENQSIVQKTHLSFKTVRTDTRLPGNRQMGSVYETKPY